MPAKIEIGDKSLMLIILLEKCNFACIHCAREDEPMDLGYKLSFGQLQSCLSDCRSLDTVSWVHFSGGEPTLWREGNRDLLDLLLEISKAGFTPGFTTNGSFFTDYSKCDNFFRKYVDGSTKPLRLYFSIDTFHNNFDAKRGRARSLDNVIKCRQELPSAKEKLLEIAVIVVISRESKSLLPDEMIRHYESLGVSFGFIPLYCKGKAESFSHLCPDLSSDNPEDLGAYQRFHQKATRKKRDETKDRNRADHINLIGNDYFFANPWRKVARLGHVPDEIIQAYTSASG
jgi:MoaA/NifB/PqqE/SkfB family radical SAM enzyme